MIILGSCRNKAFKEQITFLCACIAVLGCMCMLPNCTQMQIAHSSFKNEIINLTDDGENGSATESQLIELQPVARF